MPSATDVWRLWLAWKLPSTRASFLGGYRRKYPQTHSHNNPSLGDSTRQLLPCYCRMPQRLLPTCAWRSSLLAFSSVILAASAATLHPSMAFLLKCTSIPFSVNDPKEDIALYLVSSHVLPLGAPMLIHLTMCTSIFLLSSCSLHPPLWLLPSVRNGCRLPFFF